MKKKTIIIICVILVLGIIIYNSITTYKNKKQDEFQRMWLQYNIATKNYTTDYLFTEDETIFGGSRKKFFDYQQALVQFFNLPDLIFLLNQQIILYNSVLDAYKSNLNADKASLDLLENNTSIADLLSDNLNLDQNITRRMFYDRLTILTDMCVLIFLEVAERELPLIKDKLLTLHKKLLTQSDIMGKFLSSGM